MATELCEWQCSSEDVRRIVAELRPVIDGFAARSARDLARWAGERQRQLASQRLAS